MKLQLLSDLHLERDPAYRAQPAPGAGLLVLAGDIGSYQAGSKLLAAPGEEDFGLGRFSPRLGTWPEMPVLYVPGNHEYDGRDHAATRVQLRALCERLGITWLDREVVVIGGLRFIGCTLWTDFDALATWPDARGHTPDYTQALRLREKAFRAADFYLSKNSTVIDGEPARAAQLRELGLADQAWLRQALAQPWDGPTVVVTHFAPSLRSADPRYGITPGSAGFCNGLDDLLAKADLWLHGHLHCPCDWRAGPADRPCRVIANPRGYAHKGEQAGFIDGQCLFWTAPLRL
jgi:hypothetical protein